MRFAGKELDPETGFENFGARYYRQTWGRFTQVDPLHVGAALADPQQWNRYAYARNNPLRFVDPTGMLLCGADFANCIEYITVSGNGTGFGAGGAGSSSTGGYGLGGLSSAPIVDRVDDLLFLADGTCAGADRNGGQYTAPFACPTDGSSDGDTEIKTFVDLAKDIAKRTKNVEPVIEQEALTWATVPVAAAIAPIASKVTGWFGRQLAKFTGSGAGEVEVGTKVFRVWGDAASANGRSWATVNPGSVSNYRSAAGLPLGNTGRFVSEGVIQDITGISTRSAFPLDGNPGGLLEVVIPNPASQVRLTRVSGVNPPF